MEKENKMSNETFIRICDFEELVNVLFQVSGFHISKEYLRNWLREECMESDYSYHTTQEEDYLPY